jgi:hypothetical protein
MPYRIAGIDVHKKKLAVVVADLELGGETQFERRWYGSHPEQLRALAEWLIEQQVKEVVMESTAQYWKPVWGQPVCQKRKTAGPKSGTLHLAQALSNRGRRGRKKDFVDCERLIKRLVSGELILSFVPRANASGAQSPAQGINSRVTERGCRTSWRPCSKRRISNYPV